MLTQPEYVGMDEHVHERGSVSIIKESQKSVLFMFFVICMLLIVI